MGRVFTDRATAFIERHRAEPFFLYFAPHAPHVPRVPGARFVGATPFGPRGDAIAELDWSVGEVLATLDRLGLAGNTLVVFTSDNGPVVDDGYRDEAVEKLGSHRPAGLFRGGKYSAFEGGTRVPFLVRWPGRVEPAVSDALVCQVDLLASLAALTGQALAGSDGSDSENLIDALLGRRAGGRERLVEQAWTLALRRGSWKYIEPSGGPPYDAQTRTELGTSRRPQLYDLAADPGETRNLAGAHAALVNELATELRRERTGAGR